MSGLALLDLRPAQGRDDAPIPCVEHDAELWFAARPADLEMAKRLCQPCPLRAGCLSAALDRQEPWGVWGGQLFIDGVVVAHKRGRGRPPKAAVA